MALIWVTKAEHIKNFKIHLLFNDEASGIVDLENHLDGKVFEPLRDLDFFKRFDLDSWTLTWPNGADYSPEFLYDLIMNRLEHEKHLESVKL